MSDTPETPITPGPPTPINGVPVQPAAGSPTTPIPPVPGIPPYVGTTPPSAPAATPASATPPAPATDATPSEYPTSPGSPTIDGGQIPPAGDTEPLAPFASEPAAPVAPGTTRQRSTATIVVVALVVGAVIGGVSGAGVALLTNHNAGSPTSATVDPTTINVNNPGDATTVTAVAAKASPSVVTIGVTTSDEGGTGSGVVLTNDGYILTNTHVVTLDGESSDGKIVVTLNDGRIFTGKLIGTDPVSDLAVIKIATTGLTPATFADSSKLNVGDAAVAIGAPLGLSGTVTDGIVSALNRSITIASSAVPDDQSSSQDGSTGGSPFSFDFPGQGSQSTTTQSTATISLAVIQTDAAINPGNSGGALLNDKGQVIGINVAIASASDTSTSGTQSGSIGVGFSIPANLAQRVAKELMANGSATHGLLGASIVNDDSSTGTTTTTQSVAGAVVSDVTAGGAAEKAGIKKGDIITKFNGLPVTDYTDLIAQVRADAAGATATLTYVRDGAASQVNVTLGTLK